MDNARLAGMSLSVAGEGPPILLLHSLLADAGSLKPLAERLLPSMRVIIPDLPGFGGSPPVGGGLAEIAGEVVHALGTLGLDRVPVVLGNGFGSFVALRLALDHPAFAGRLILAGTGAGFSEAGKAAFRAMREAATRGGLEAIADVAMRRLFSPEFQAENPRLLAERRAAFLATDPAMFTEACTALEELDLRPELARLTLPVLVVAGSLDEATPPAMARELVSLLPDARLAVLDGLAHVPQLQAPDEFLAAIGEFIR
ncbi:MAG TPA: alpha/beta fold hydrolase, partial [Acetobacteraceae bacterium]|nr:alpha/beta fold hydrolase [Acetobacteraceae bacterium]